MDVDINTVIRDMEAECGAIENDGVTGQSRFSKEFIRGYRSALSDLKTWAKMYGKIRGS